MSELRRYERDDGIDEHYEPSCEENCCRYGPRCWECGHTRKEDHDAGCVLKFTDVWSVRE